MSRPSRQQVTVVGSGAFGAAIAVELARRGARVVQIEESPLGRSASAVAAGMLAPAMESALDPASAGRFALFAAARDLWPAFAEGLGPTGLERCGALLRAPGDVLARVSADLAAQGCQTTVSEGALHTSEDWRIEPRLALAAMRDGLLSLGGEVRTGRAVDVVGEGVVLSDGSVVRAEAIVLACGFGGLHLAPELSVLTPIKGQILRFPGAVMTDGPILRGETGYVAPGRDGPVCGATMEEGVSDLLIDGEAVSLLQARAATLAPQLAGERASAMAGIRASTPDGLPIVGPSSLPRVWLATGARRNGWLLAPMVAGLIARQVMGEDDGEVAAIFAPGRFSFPY